MVEVVSGEKWVDDWGGDEGDNLLKSSEVIKIEGFVSDKLLWYVVWVLSGERRVGWVGWGCNLKTHEIEKRSYPKFGGDNGAG